MNKAKHKQRHIELHHYLDELIADFIRDTNKLPSQTSLSELMNWSFEQIKNPNGEKK